MLQLSELTEKILRLEYYDKEEVADSVSATTIIKDIREIILLERYKDKLPEISLEKKFSPVIGSLLHYALENLSEKLGITEAEQRLFWEINGIKISGKFDFIKDKKMGDYKFPSNVFTEMYSPYGKPEWIKQLSINRYLYYKNKGIVLDDMGWIELWYLDWRKKERDMRRKDGQLSKKWYPPTRGGRKLIPLMPLNETEEFLKEKTRDIKKYREVEDRLLPPCQDTWNGKKCESWCLVKEFCNKAEG